MNAKRWTGVLGAVALIACGPESDEIVYGIQAMFFANSEWSAPVNLGPVINSTAIDNHAAISKDGLSLFFASNREKEAEAIFGNGRVVIDRRGIDHWAEVHGRRPLGVGKKHGLDAVHDLVGLRAAGNQRHRAQRAGPAFCVHNSHLARGSVPCP